VGFDRNTLFDWLAEVGLTKMYSPPAVANPTAGPAIIFNVTLPRKTLIHTLLVINGGSVAMQYTIQEDTGAGWVDIETITVPPASYVDVSPQYRYNAGAKLRLGALANVDADGESQVIAQYIMLQESSRLTP